MAGRAPSRGTRPRIASASSRASSPHRTCGCSTSCRAVKKAQKHYHFDFSPIADEAARFENLVAGHLLKWIHREEDLEGRDLELRYFRDVDGREVDFVVVERRKPILFVECKLTSGPLDAGLRYLVERFPRVPAWQIAMRGDRDAKTPEGIRLAPALTLLSTLA